MGNRDRTRQGHTFRSILILWSFCPVNPVLWALHGDISLPPFSHMGCTAPLTTSAFHMAPQKCKISKHSEKTQKQSTQRKTFCAFCRTSGEGSSGSWWTTLGQLLLHLLQDQPNFLTHFTCYGRTQLLPPLPRPLPSHLFVHQESFSTDPATVRAELDAVILFMLTVSYLFDLQAVHVSGVEYSSSLTC